MGKWFSGSGDGQENVNGRDKIFFRQRVIASLPASLKNTLKKAVSFWIIEGQFAVLYHGRKVLLLFCLLIVQKKMQMWEPLVFCCEHQRYYVDKKSGFREGLEDEIIGSASSTGSFTG